MRRKHCRWDPSLWTESSLGKICSAQPCRDLHASLASFAVESWWQLQCCLVRGWQFVSSNYCLHQPEERHVCCHLHRIWKSGGAKLVWFASSNQRWNSKWDWAFWGGEGLFHSSVRSWEGGESTSFNMSGGAAGVQSEKWCTVLL